MVFCTRSWLSSVLSPCGHYACVPGPSRGCVRGGQRRGTSGSSIDEERGNQRLGGASAVGPAAEGVLRRTSLQRSTIRKDAFRSYMQAAPIPAEVMPPHTPR